MRQFLFSFFVLLLTASSAVAQEKKVHLDIAGSVGTTGLGIELNVKPSPWVGIRVGGNYTPHINMPNHYGWSVGGTQEWILDENGERHFPRFEKMADLMYDLTGNRPDQRVKMNRYPTMNNVKLLVDVYPFKNKKWHGTVGFYYGNRNFAYGENDIHDAAMLTTVATYNNIYTMVMNEMPVRAGSKNIYLGNSFGKLLEEYGKVTVALGTFTHDIYDDDGNVLYHEGDHFYLEPDDNCMVTVDARVNRFKPFVGLGYMGNMTKKSDRWKIGFDAGVMFWGGHPTATTTRKEQTIEIDGKGQKYIVNKYYDLDLTRDVTGLPVECRQEITFLKILRFLPVLELKICYNIFE